METRVIRAQFTEDTIRVYQAFSPTIAEPAVQSQRFGVGFKMGRMTWIKPSFCWMMYRSKFATSSDQERILAIDLKRSGFEWALEHSVLASYHPEMYERSSWEQLIQSSPVRVQWDPERDIRLEKVEGVRAIQIGISGRAVDRYVNDWIVGISDVTYLANTAKGGEVDDLFGLGIHERLYPLPPRLTKKIGGDDVHPSSNSFS